MKNPKHLLTEAVDGRVDLLYKLRREKKGPLSGDLVYKSYLVAIEEDIAFHAPVYCWDPEIIETVVGSMESLPLDAKMDRSLLYTDKGWWWFGRDNRQFRGRYSKPELLMKAEQVICGLGYSWTTDTTGDFCCIYAYSYDHNEPSPGPVPVWTAPWKEGETLGEFLKDYISLMEGGLNKAAQRENRKPFPTPEIQIEYDKTILEIASNVHKTTNLFARFFVAANVWLRHKILEQTPASAPKPAAKRAARANMSTSSLCYVHLRKKAHTRKPIEGEGKPVEWSCRWWVEGFFRNQWYPSERKHKLIWIDEFVKGPDDKPLKPRSEKVFVVDR